MTSIADPKDAFKPQSELFGARLCPVAKIVKPVRLPWRIVVDTAEQQPFTFQGIKADAAKQYRFIQVEVVTRCLGRYPNSLGDYSLEAIDGTYHGAAAWCYVERKSLEDLQSTLLGFADGHRARFESELSNMRFVIHSGGAALVVVECDLCELLNTTPPTTKSPQVVARGLHRSVVSLWREYGVPWAFCGSRRLAEITTFRFLESFWKHRKAREERIDHAS